MIPHTDTRLGVGAFDIDGTLIQHREKPDYLSSESLRQGVPDMATCAKARTMIELGVEVHFITGRSKAVRDVTLEQLRSYVHPDIPATRLHMQDSWTNYETMADWKAKVLGSVGAEWYVGDHEADRKAAHLLGIGFLFVQNQADPTHEAPWAVV